MRKNRNKEELDVCQDDVSEENMGGMGNLIFKTLGFSQENIDSIRSIIDSIKVTEEGDKKIINVALKNVKVIIEK